MANFTILEEVDQGLLQLIQSKLIESGIIKNYNLISLCNPKNQIENEVVVAIHPYNIREYRESSDDFINSMPNGSTIDGPAQLEIKYIISISSQADHTQKASEESRILGKIIQTLKDEPSIMAIDRSTRIAVDVPIILDNTLDSKEESDLLNRLNCTDKYILYLAGPVPLDSASVYPAKPRVESMGIDSQQFEPVKKIDYASKLKFEDIDDEWTEHPDEQETESEDSDNSGMDSDTDSEDMSLDDDTEGNENEDSENTENNSEDNLSLDENLDKDLDEDL